MSHFSVTSLHVRHIELLTHQGSDLLCLEASQLERIRNVVEGHPELPLPGLLRLHVVLLVLADQVLHCLLTDAPNK